MQVARWRCRLAVARWARRVAVRTYLEYLSRAHSTRATQLETGRPGPEKDVGG